jgi:hypothetical protein
MIFFLRESFKGVSSDVLTMKAKRNAKFKSKLFFFSLLDIYSSGPNFDEMLLLETELPDELMQGASSSWEHVVTNKPPAQGPGPGQQQQQQQQMYNAQMNGGEESIVPANVASLQQQQQQQQQQRQHSQQQLAHLLQQGQKSMVNPHMNQLTKNPIQGGNPNATVMNNLVNMPMSMAPNNNGTNANMPMTGEILFINN